MLYQRRIPYSIGIDSECIEPSRQDTVIFVESSRYQKANPFSILLAPRTTFRGFGLAHRECVLELLHRRDLYAWREWALVYIAIEGHSLPSFSLCCVRTHRTTHPRFQMPLDPTPCS